MKTHDIDQLLHVIKPDGHGANPLATELHRLACALQEQTDKVHAAITTVTSPKYKGEVTGELIPWPDHYPLELDHTDERLDDIMVRGASVSGWLDEQWWEKAEEYIHDRFDPEISEATRRKIARMDESELYAERAA